MCSKKSIERRIIRIECSTSLKRSYAITRLALVKQVYAFIHELLESRMLCATVGRYDFRADLFSASNLFILDIVFLATLTPELVESHSVERARFIQNFNERVKQSVIEIDASGLLQHQIERLLQLIRQ